MPNPPNITVDIVEGLETIEEFINLIVHEFGISEDDVNLTSIDVFTITAASVEIENSNYAFTLGVTIDIEQEDLEEGEGSTKELSGNLSIIMKGSGTNYEGEYGGNLIIPTDKGDLGFSLGYQTKVQGTKKTKLVVGTLDVNYNPDKPEVNLSSLVSEICPALGTLFPEELLETFHLGGEAIFSINSTPLSNPTANRKNQNKMLFSIGFGGEIAFSEFPLVGTLLPESFTADSGFAFEFLVSLQRFTQSEIKTINGLLEELGTPLRIKPPCTNINYLERGANIGANFNIGPFIMGWLLPLKRKKTTTPTPPSRSLSGSNTGSSSNTNTTSSNDIITLSDNGVWLMVQKSFGPLYFDKVGLVYKKGEIHLTPKFVIQVSQFSLSLNALSASSPLSEWNPTFHLDGFGLELISRSLEIGGAFLVVQGEDGDKEYQEYLGTATIGIKGKVKPSLALSAIGSFADYKDSGKFALFLYLAADFPFGGPPFFFVTGISGGFGYNEDLIVPELADIREFPLVAQAIDGSGKVDLNDPGQTIADQLEGLENYIIPAVGSGFGAVGLKFTCFKIIDGFGLMTIGMSQGDFEINLLGIATIMLPTTINTRFEPIAVAELAIIARFNPMGGEIIVQGELTPNSYIFSRNCHLTGGFAYGLWFLPPRFGDFVFTQGGYHPHFLLADRYPTVPRLGMNWQIDDNSHTRAEVYFALCGHGIMAGGLFSIAYHLGAVWASFDAGVNFLLGWAPYHYDIEIHVHVAAGIGAVSVGLGVGIRFWGPDFGCKFKIRILVAAITIKIGDQSSVYPLPIGWDEFETTFLPEPKDVCSITSVDGLVKQIFAGEDLENQEEIWVINPTTFELSTDSLVPTKRAFTGKDELNLVTDTNFGINSMGVGVDELETIQKVTIIKDLQGDKEVSAEYKFKFEPIPKLAPTSEWGAPNMLKGYIKPPEVNAEQFIENVFFGFRILPAKPPKPGKSNVIGVEHLQYETVAVDERYYWESFEPFVPNSEYDEQQKRDRIRDTVVTNSQRDSILTALGLELSDVNIEADQGQAIANSFIFAPLVK